jgi:hypothetical protein
MAIKREKGEKDGPKNIYAAFAAMAFRPGKVCRLRQAFV